MLNLDGCQEPQTVCELQVSTFQPRGNQESLLTRRSRYLRTAFYCVSSPRHFESRTSTLNLFLPHIRIDVQSKECQPKHWKALHKATCSSNAAVIQILGETPKEKAWSKKTRRWTNVWIPIVSCCSLIALDLANHEWGRHETHAYVSSAVQACVL